MRNRTVILALFLLAALPQNPARGSEEGVASFLREAFANLPVTGEPCREPYAGPSLRTTFTCVRPSADFEGFRDAWEATVTDPMKVPELPSPLAEWQTQAGGRIRWYALGDRWLVVTWDQVNRQVVFGYAKDDAATVPLTREVAPPRRLPINTADNDQKRDARVGLRPDAQGLVVLHARIATNGAVEGVEVLGAVPRHKGLEEAASQAIRRWRYAPAVKDGEPVALEMSVTFTYGPGGSFRVWEADSQGASSGAGLGSHGGGGLP
jgi:TonB family protein